MVSISVVVPTYQRPDYLEKCVRSLFVQTHLPDEIILVSRDSDAPTNVRIRELQRELGGGIPIYNPQVSEPGFLPPLIKGMGIARMDVVVFFDDDAEAFPDWLERMVSHYADASVAGVGGRCVSYYEGRLLQFSAASRVSVITWYGDNIGNMYRELTFEHPVPATHLMGGNSSYRRHVLQSVGFDPYLNKDVAVGWELDIGLSIIGRGHKLIFDPLARVNHYTAPRETVGMRPGHGQESVYFMARNMVYIMGKHLPYARKVFFFIYTFLIGKRSNLGCLSFLVCLLLSRDRTLLDRFRATMQGKWAGWRDAAHYRRCHPSINSGPL